MQRRQQYWQRGKSSGFNSQPQALLFMFESPTNEYYYLNDPLLQEDIYYHQSAPNWVGKLLVRKDQKPPPNYPNSGIVYESDLPGRYTIIKPQQTKYGYDPDRLAIYVDQQGMIEYVHYG